MSTQPILEKYQTYLSSIPAPGGNGCRTALVAIMNRHFIKPERIKRNRKNDFHTLHGIC